MSGVSFTVSLNLFEGALPELCVTEKSQKRRNETVLTRRKYYRQSLDVAAGFFVANNYL
jgi:hypothetical protein